MDSGERMIRVESVRMTKYRESNGSCLTLATHIEKEGLYRPITLWTDGTLISGQRRLFAHMLLRKERIQAVYVNTIEEAAKRLLGDNQAQREALPMPWSDVCRLWEVLRRLDGPAAVRRADEARRRGVELRRKTQAGLRKPGRESRPSDDYLLTVACEPFGISYATARRIDRIYHLGYGTAEAADERRELAREAMKSIDETGNVWHNYQRLMDARGPAMRPLSRPTQEAVESAPAARQRAVWAKALPQMEGLVAGLAELGPPNPGLTWEQAGPVHARLSAIRRDLEKMIRQMKETSKS